MGRRANIRRRSRIDAGERFGKLTLVEKTGATKDGRAIWRCKCDCGGFVEKPAYSLRRTKLPMCDACKKEGKKKIDAGERFGKLTLVEKTGATKDGRAIWRCKCDCGGFVEKPAYSLRRTKFPMCAACCKKKYVKSVLRPGLKVFDLQLVDIFSSANTGGVIWSCKCVCGRIVYVEDEILRPVVREINSIKISCTGRTSANQDKDIVECLSLIRNIKKTIKRENYE